jgi:hypothetical protein
MGTAFHLADCYESIGRYTRAWIFFVDVAAEARAQGQKERESVARARASKLEGRLSRVSIVVIDPAEGLTVTRDGQPVPAPQWGTAVPVEPGRHRIEVQAPGRRSWTREVKVAVEGATVSVKVPRLPLAPVRPEPEPDASLDVRRAAAIAMAALAVGAVAAGTASGIVAIERKDDAAEHCPQPDACFARGIELRDEAREAAAVSTVSFVIAASAAAGSLVLWLTAPDRKAESDRTAGRRARLSIGAGGISVSGRW